MSEADSIPDLHSLSASFEDAELPPLAESRKRIRKAQRRLWARGERGLLLVFQGLDASGKDGVIRRLVNAMDPMGVQVSGFGRPTEKELRHDFLWRVWPLLPGRGDVAIFNRSHYEAVLTERVLADGAETAADGEPWTARYRIIREMERHLGASGIRVIKFWLHVSAGKQRKRLLKRLKDETRQWKFEPADLESWKRRDEYLEAAAVMIGETHTDEAPWHLVPADHKKSARRAIAGIVADALEELAPDWPEADRQLCETYRTLLAPE